MESNVITYPEGGISGTILRQKQVRTARPIDNVRVQLIPTRPAPKAKINNPEDVVKLVRELEDADREYAKMIFLDTKNQVIGIETISIGSLNASIVHPREALKGAILSSSASTIFVHNHPSGTCEPSNEDVEITGKLKEAFETVSIALLDSIIVGKGCHFSLREAGYITGKAETPAEAASKFRVSESIRRAPVRGMFPELCPTCRYECLTCPYRVNPERKLYKFVGTREKPKLVSPRLENLRVGTRLARMSDAKEFWIVDIQKTKELGKDVTIYFLAGVQALGFGGEIKCDLRQIQNYFMVEEERALGVTDSRHTISENIQTVNNIEVFLNRLTVDTRVPIPESAVIGAAIPEGRFLFAYHITDDPEGVMRKLRSNIPLCQMNPEGDLGCGFYVSGVPEYWRVRSREKWEFARHLNRAQRQALVNVILSDPKYRKGGGYLADFEVGYLNRDLKQFIETGDVNLLAMTGNQPYNVRITEEIARKAGVPIPKIPRLVKVKLQGKFINAVGLYSNPKIVNRAQAWAVINRPKMLQYDKRASAQDIVNAWLCSKGYSGAFTKSGMSTNPEMVVWDRKAIIDAWIPEPQT